jgi:hypothetical protein
MRNELLGHAIRPQETLIASFGGAQILKHLNGKLEIRGGTEDEKAQAHDWMRRFLTSWPLTIRKPGG